MTENGLELHAVVAADQSGWFRAGTRYGPKGGAMSELGPEDYYQTEHYAAKEQAIFAAKTETTSVWRDCNAFARAERVLEKATAPGRESKAPALTRPRLIDR